jgi:hypothetical protein
VLPEAGVSEAVLDVTEDRTGLWIAALQASGVDTDALIARVDPDTGPRWYPLPHSEFDGVGAFGHLLRQHGHPDLGGLPQNEPQRRPGWLSLLRAGAQFTEFPFGRGVSLRMASSSMAPLGRNIAWRVLDEAQTSRLVARAKAEGVSVNAWLLFTLTRSLAPLLDNPARPSRWMIPVNMRGKVRSPRDTANHVAYVRLPVSQSDSARAIQDRIRARLDGFEDWWLWYCYRYGSLVGPRLMRILARADLRWSKPYLGCFSNLGAWNLSGPGAWICCPPVARTMPVGAGCLTYGGRMGLALRFHSTADDVQEVTDQALRAWVGQAGV